jgi:hypothetical protein
MPTKTNVEKLDSLQSALGQMIELKKAVDRIEGEMRMVKSRKEGILGGGAAVAMEGVEVIDVEEEEKKPTSRASSVKV